MRRRIIACNRQQRWPYKILSEQLQELEEKPNFSVTLIFECFATLIPNLLVFSKTYDEKQKKIKCKLIYGHEYIKETVGNEPYIIK